MKCEKCGSENTPGGQFCQECGSALSVTQTTPPSPTPQAGSFTAPQGSPAPAPQAGSFTAPQSSPAPAPQGGSFTAPQGSPAPAPQGNSFQAPGGNTPPPKKKKTALIVILIAVAAFILLAVVGGILLVSQFLGGKGDNMNTTSASGMAPSTSTNTAPAMADGEVSFTNASDLTVFRMYISETTDDSWGEDVLGSAVINSGDTFSLMLPQGASVYDILLRDYDDIEYTFFDITLEPGFTLTYTGANGGTIDVYNLSGELIQTSSLNAPAAPTSTATNADTGVATDSVSINLETLGGVGIVNNSDITIFRLYVSQSDDSQWGDDVLGASTVANGEHFIIPLNEAGISYDIRVEDASGNYYDFYQVLLDPDEILVFNGTTLEHYLSSGNLYQEVPVA